MPPRRASIRRLARVSLLAALSLVLSYLETMIPLPVALPGVKLGLGNIAVVVALFVLDVRSALAVACVKVLASGLLFGSPMMLLYSLGGTALAFCGMAALSRVRGVSVVLVSMVAAILHNVGQLAVACVVLSSAAVFLSLPALAAAALVTGGLTGVVAAGVAGSVRAADAPRPRIAAEGLLVAPGERVAFVGANGSGKTTCALQLAGLSGAPEDAAALAAGIAFQDPDDQIVSSRVRDDVVFGPENRGISRGEMRRIVADSLARAGAEALAGRDVATLSGGQKQHVAVAGLLAMAPGMLVFDEATSMLDARSRAAFEALVSDLTGQGMAVVQVTQIMEEAFAADRIAVFDGGALAFVGTPEELLRERRLLERCGLEPPACARLAYALQERGLAVPPTCDPHVLEDAVAACCRGSAASEPADGHRDARRHGRGQAACKHAAPDGADSGRLSRQPASKRPRADAPAGEKPCVGLSLRGVSFAYEGASEQVVRDVSLRIVPGELVGIVGESGCGKTTLLRLLAGLELPSEGEVVLEDEAAGAGTELHPRLKSCVGLVGQLPERQLFAKTVFEDVAFGPRNAGLPEAEVEQRVRESLSSVGLDPDAFAVKSPFALSGGEQRRVAIAGVLALRPGYLLLDEPTAGLDPRRRDELMALAERLADSGTAVVVVSHDVDALAAHVRRLVAVERGSIAFDGGIDEALRGGFVRPFAASFAQRLRARGVESGLAHGHLPRSVEELARALAPDACGGDAA